MHLRPLYTSAAPRAYACQIISCSRCFLASCPGCRCRCGCRLIDGCCGRAPFERPPPVVSAS
eukprot:scaffold15694_cov112-Isochrysis_galbana.AAC.1